MINETYKKLEELLTYTDSNGTVYLKGRLIRYNDGTITLFTGNTRYEELKEQLLKFNVIKLESLNNSKHLTIKG